MAKMGRPTLYNPELGLELCARMVGAEGAKPRSLVSVCNDDDMPGYRTVMTWLNDDRLVDFQHNYARAQDHRAQAIFEEMRDIAETPLEAETETVKETKDGTFTETKRGDNVERSKLMVNVAQWQLARMAPKKYGDKTQIEHSGKVGMQFHTTEDADILDRAMREREAELTTQRKETT